MNINYNSFNIEKKSEDIFEIIHCLDVEIKRYDFNHYKFVHKINVADYSYGYDLIHSLPQEWLDYYYQKKYEKVDPVIPVFAQSQLPFRCRDMVNYLPHITQRKRSQRLFKDAAKFGLVESYAFPVHGRGGLLGGGFIAGLGAKLTNSDISHLDMVMRATFWKLLQHYDLIDRVLNINLAKVVRITKREQEILVLISGGNTSPEIAKCLSISSHTVDWYINSIQQKFEAKNRQHVIALAFRQGLLT